MAVSNSRLSRYGMPLIQLADPDVYEVLQGIDLLDPDAAFVGFGDHNFTAGMGAFIKK